MTDILKRYNLYIPLTWWQVVVNKKSLVIFWNEKKNKQAVFRVNVWETSALKNVIKGAASINLF